MFFFYAIYAASSMTGGGSTVEFMRAEYHTWEFFDTSKMFLAKL